MKKILLVLSVLVVASSYSVSRAEEAKKKANTVTLKGTLVDTKCYLEDGAKNNNHMDMKACGTSCLNDGTPAGLLVGDKLYILIFPAPVFADYAGKTVEITGEIYGEMNLVPEKADLVEKGQKKAIKLAGKSMM